MSDLKFFKSKKSDHLDKMVELFANAESVLDNLSRTAGALVASFKNKQGITPEYRENFETITLNIKKAAEDVKKLNHEVTDNMPEAVSHKV